MSPLAGQSPLFAAALSWLDFGVDLLPAQPGSKHLVAGFGPHQKHISQEDAARAWFSDRSCNLVLVTGVPGGLVVLDCDSESAYAEVTSQLPGIRNTLTVRTRRGYHSYFLYTKPLRSGHVGEIELKADGACVITPPSIVGGHVYRWENEEAQLAEFPADLPLLSQLFQPVSVNGSAPDRALKGSMSIVAQVKRDWPIVDLVGKSVKLTPDRAGRWHHGTCPFCGHQNDFWVDRKRGTWGCFACLEHGDVINWYAMMNGLTVADAVRAMADAAVVP